MATITTTGFNLRGVGRTKAAGHTTRDRRRHISADAGHALELLGHAIEYLTDELVQEGRRLDARCSQVEAIQILMAMNRKVYYECPFRPTLVERLRAFLHIAPSAGAR